MTLISKAQVAASLDARIFELILLPTEQCNFRCTYCYEDFEIGRMPAWVQDALKLLIERRSESLELLSLSWFGGEPLAAFDIVEEIADFSNRIAQRTGMQVIGGLTTNGSLLSTARLDRLAALNHRSMQITLDGDREQHNKTRIRANGRGTFDEIWENLLLVRDHPEHFDVMLRLHVSKENAESLKLLLNKIEESFGGSSKFRIHFHRISNLGGAGGATVDQLGWEEYKSLLEGFKRRTTVRSESEVSMVEQGEICYAAKPNSLLVRADGRIGKCTVALNDPRNDVGMLNRDGTITFNNPRLQLWFEGFREMRPEVLGCPLSKLGHESPRRVEEPSEQKVISSLLQ